LVALLALVFQLSVPLKGAFGARVTGDEPFYLLTTVSLIEDGDLDLANQYASEAYRAFLGDSVPLWTQSVPTPDGRLLSPHNPGLPLLVVPAYLWDGVDGVKRFLSVLGALTIGCAYVLARRTTTAPVALLAALLVGVSAPIFVYATQVYPEVPAALCVVLLVMLIRSQSRYALRGVAAALLLGALLWLGVKYAPLAACFGFLVCIRLNIAGRVVLVATLLPLGGHYAAFHWQTYGDLTPYAVNLTYAGSTTPELLARHLELGERVYRLFGLWVDREFGLVRWAPILLLALPGAWLSARQAGHLAAPLLAAVAVQVLVAMFLSITMRGWWFPGRMLIVVLPLLVPLVACAVIRVQRRLATSALTIALAGGTLSATIGLWLSASSGDVTTAVNPFDAGGLWLDLTRPVFPLYTAYTLETLVLSVLWLALAIGVHAFSVHYYHE
jgi:hypothetical protein